MITIHGYKNLTEIYKSPKTLIYRAIREQDSKKVIIKLLRKEYPDPDEIEKFKHEYNITNKLRSIKGILKNYELLLHKNSLAIVMEDINGESLTEILKRKKSLELKTFLSVSIKLTEVIDEIHKKNIIHKDIKPSNIIVNLNKQNIKIIDFSISSELLKETQTNINPDHLEGTLAYISPEQTGRMNRSIDYRTDYYSLGVTFYEMLTGKMPFESTDPMELVYSHIARIPVAPRKTNNKIPSVLSNIIMKLLSKTAEDRYQSAAGIRHDLESCQNQLIENGKIENFIIGKKDISDRLHLPEKLYGRDKEISVLMKTFNNIINGKKGAIFFNGEAGIGKSALINEIQKPITEKKGYFISGKFDRLKSNIPYSGIIQAFQELAKIILAESKNKLKIWREDIQNAVGNNGKIITSIIPEIEIIIGKQDEIIELSPIESQNRFKMVFENFIKVFASKDHPLVLFLDDVQWIDSASLNLMELLLNESDLRHFLFIGSFREHEISKSAILNLFLDKIKSNMKNMSIIQLKNLREENIIELLQDMFNIGIKKTRELGKIILDKTNGNPFFIKEFINNLYDKGYIKYKKGWQFNINEIDKLEVTTNVVDLIVDRIMRLDEKTLEIMKIASCLGMRFYFETLGIIFKKKEDEIINDLIEAFNEGVIIKYDDYGKFVHDRVREATYSIIKEKEKKIFHYLLGKLISKHIKFRVPEDRLFIVTNQFNLAKDLLKRKEKENLIELNLKAGKKAKLSIAHDTASGYFNSALSLLSSNSWEMNYKITLDLHSELCESEYMLGNYDRLQEIFSIIQKKAQKPLDKIPAYKIIILYKINSMNYREAIDCGIEIINELGFKFPRLNGINFFFIIKEFIRTNILLRKLQIKFNAYEIEKILELPVSTNIIIREIFELFLNFSTAIYASYPDKLVYFVLKYFNVILDYGLSYLSSIVFIGLALILPFAFKKYELGYQFGNLALKTLKKFNNKKLGPFVNFQIGNHTIHWREHIRESIEYLGNGYHEGIEIGDYQWGAYSMAHICKNIFLTGKNLNEVKLFFDNITTMEKKMNQKDIDPFFYSTKQLVYSLLGYSKNKYKLAGEWFDEDMGIETLKNFNILASLYYCYTMKLFLSVILNDYKEAYRVISESSKYTNTCIGQFQTFFYLLFKGLTYLNADNYNTHIKHVKKIARELYLLSVSCPENFSQMYFLLSAEIARVKNKDNIAIKNYDLAIKFAKDNEFIYMEALANELAANFFKSRTMDRIFRTYMTEACYCYSKWGAKAKTEELEKQYPEIFETLNTSGFRTEDILSRTFSTISISKTSSEYGSLDLDTIIKASMTISGEIEMKSLMSKLIKILMENAGAQRGFIIMNKEGKLTIEAKCIVGKKPIILKSIPLEHTTDISYNIINYVERTKEIINLDNAVNDGRFSSDPYIIGASPKSILCIPILNQNNLIGILYLENDLTTGAFSMEHQEVLKILSSQAAISIQNIYLYESAKEKELLQKEFKMASEIQMSMLPSELPQINGYDIDAICIMAKEAGGDLYDIIQLDEYNFLIAIGDVSGKGMPAALYMSSTINIVRTIVESMKSRDNNTKETSYSTAEIIKVLNRLLGEIMKNGKFVTIFIGILNIKNHAFMYTSSGHDPGIIFNPAEKNYKHITTIGQASGIINEEIFNNAVEEKNVEINKGDYIILYTDGITEAKNNGGEEYMGNFFKSIKLLNGKENAKDVIYYILNRINKFVKNVPQYDDMTILCIKRL